jgi:hypothetical protein
VTGHGEGLAFGPILTAMNATPLRPALPDHTPSRIAAPAHLTTLRATLHGGRGRVVVTAGLLAGVLLITAACGKKGSGDPQADPTFGTTITESGAAPSTGADSSASPAASGQPKPSSTSGGGGNQAPTYPANAKDYGLALLAAWGAGNKARIDQLAIQAAALQFGGQPAVNGQWTNRSCTPNGSNGTVCAYRNAHGDDAEVTMNNAQLGHPTAATNFMIDRTRYPAAAGDYVTTFMAAWSAGNKERMARLSSSAIAGSFSGKTPPTGSQTGAVQNGGSWTVTVTGLPLGSGNWTFTVTGAKLGAANAITAVTGN